MAAEATAASATGEAAQAAEAARLDAVLRADNAERRVAELESRLPQETRAAYEQTGMVQR